jgi:hypothetical protein
VMITQCNNIRCLTKDPLMYCNIVPCIDISDSVNIVNHFSSCAYRLTSLRSGHVRSFCLSMFDYCF